MNFYGGLIMEDTLTMTQTQDLSNSTCIPCKEGDKPLTPSEAEAMMASVPEWELLNHGRIIIREYRFSNFKKSFAFVEKVSALAEQQGHHPDIAFGWGYCAISLQTHSIEGLHQNDFIMAAKIDALAS